MNQMHIHKSADQIQAAAHSLHTTAQLVEDATDSVKKSAALVETNVSEGIQPDLRDLRVYVSELNETTNVRIKRLMVALWALFALNVVGIATALIV